MAEERPSRRPAAAVVEIHAPRAAGDGSAPQKCAAGHVDPAAHVSLQGQCRVQWLARDEHLFFGSQNRDGTARWLQIGSQEPSVLPGSRSISGMCGHIWVTGTRRVMVENLSRVVVVEIRSPHLPETTRLFPTTGDPGRPGARAGDALLETAIVALRARDNELALVNSGRESLLWVSVLTPSAGLRPRYRGTADSRRLDEGVDATAWLAKDREERAEAQEELDHAALRITLGSPDHLSLLQEFAALPEVRARWDASPTLRQWLARNEKGVPWERWVERQLRWVAEHKATHELHRLILEGLGRPPAHESRYYTQLVDRRLDPPPDSGPARGSSRPVRGGSGGLSDLVVRVRGGWGYNPRELRAYLGLGPGPERDPRRGRGLTG